jgi:hypothetical protein
MKPTRLIPILLLLALVAGGSVQRASGAGLAKRIGKPLPQATSSTLYAHQQGDGIVLRWTIVPNCDGYRLYHQSGDSLQADTPWVYISGAMSSTHQYDNVVPGGHYSFGITPVNGTEEGPLSAAVTVIMKTKQASVPSDMGK